MNAVQVVIEILKSAVRLGADEDNPEGARFIQISETLTNLMIKKLEEYLEEGTDAPQPLAHALEDNRPKHEGHDTGGREAALESYLRSQGLSK